MSPGLILTVVAGYFLLLILVSYWTSRNADNQDFFIAGRKSPWILVAVGMIGASLSGVTFISIPGVVGAGAKDQAFSYMQMVFGYLLGYFVIATVLLPIYYRQNLTSIYTYLERRFGFFSYKTGAAFFLLSRIVGASFRLFLVAIVLQKFVMDPFGIPFIATVGITIVLIWLYTYSGGIKTIVWTDTLQTICMLTAVSLTILAIGKALDTNIGGLIDRIQESSYSKMFFFEGGWNDANNFFKQFISGALIAIVMTGLDQDMMQKNLSCRSLKDAQKNVFLFSIILIFANLLFLSLGALLYIYAGEIGIAIPERTDQLFPLIALQHLPTFTGVIFVIGLIAAAYSSADSALTALTTSFCVDFLDFEKSEEKPDKLRKKRLIVHICFSVILLITIVLFNQLDDGAVISKIFVAAGYTYGPILGLFAFGILTNWQIRDRYVIVVCLLSPLISYFINGQSENWFGGFQFGHMIILLNGIITFIGLLLIRNWNVSPNNLSD
ncbi:MAG: sodium:solute symporter [Bacteroidia bacterium]|nr:sodium:solute symporter [Bacteroidia bacterium]